MATVQDYLQNPAWVHRVEQRFEIMDTNKNGYLTLEDVQLAADNLEKEVKPDAHLMANLRARKEEFYALLGIVSGKQTTKDEFVKAAAAMAIAEKARKEKGEEILIQKMHDAWFDVVDTNHDGYVRLDEFKIVMRVGGMEESAAEDIFKTLDKNKDGKIKRKEFSESRSKWYLLDDADTKGM